MAATHTPWSGMLGTGSSHEEQISVRQHQIARHLERVRECRCIMGGGHRIPTALSEFSAQGRAALEGGGCYDRDVLRKMPRQEQSSGKTGEANGEPDCPARSRGR
jgi:hypothetical protein